MLLIYFTGYNWGKNLTWHVFDPVTSISISATEYCSVTPRLHTSHPPFIILTHPLHYSLVVNHWLHTKTLSRFTRLTPGVAQSVTRSVNHGGKARSVAASIITLQLGEELASSCKSSGEQHGMEWYTSLKKEKHPPGKVWWLVYSSQNKVIMMVCSGTDTGLSLSIDKCKHIYFFSNKIDDTSWLYLRTLIMLISDQHQHQTSVRDNTEVTIFKAKYSILISVYMAWALMRHLWGDKTISDATLILPLKARIGRKSVCLNKSTPDTWVTRGQRWVMHVISRPDMGWICSFIKHRT